jgi:hypothetical protein
MVALLKHIQSTSDDWKTRGDIETYALPADWSMHEYQLADVGKLSATAINCTLTGEFPFRGATTTLTALARGKRRVVILVDDLTRFTPAATLIPSVLAQLHGAGLRAEHIRFICANGTHRPLSDEELALKVGPSVAAHYPVENHNCFADDAVLLGSTPAGTPVKINRAVAEAELVIGISTLEKHRFAYASGGAKIILPGVAHVETIEQNHYRPGKTGIPAEAHYGLMRSDMDEAGRIVAAHTNLLVVNISINRHRELTGIYLGDCVDVFRGHVDTALATYEVPFDRSVYAPTGKADIGIFRIDTLDPLQISKAMGGWEELCRIPVAVGNFGDGVVYQGLRYGPYPQYLASLADRQPLPIPSVAEFLETLANDKESWLIYSPHLDASNGRAWDERFVVMNAWEPLIQGLYQCLGGGQSVAFFHDAYLQVMRFVEG